MDDWKLEPARDLGLPPLKRYRSEWREGGLEIVAFDGRTGLLEQIVERIADDAARALCGRFCCGFR